MTFEMENTRKQTLKLAGWTWSWVATLAIATFGPKFIWDDHQLLTVLAVTVNFANGVAMLVANRQFFNSLDELQRKIHLEALAFTIGLSMIVGITYSVMDISNLIPIDAEISLLVGFMGITYMVTLLINRNRYV